MQVPSISIVTPASGGILGLEKTIASVLDQNYPNLQYIVAGAPDNTEAAQLFEKYGASITRISGQTGSNAATINQGIGHCTGEIFGWLGCYSTLAPGSLNRVAASWENNTSWITGWAQCCDLSGHDWPRMVQPIYQDFQWLRIDPLTPQASFWATRYFQQIGNFREDFNLLFDYEFRLRLHFQTGVNPAVVRQCLVSPFVDDASHPEERHAELSRILSEYRKKLSFKRRAQLWWHNQRPVRNTAFADFTD